MGLVRILTTSRAMNDKPLTMAEAWLAYDSFFKDARVRFWPEPANLEESFRPFSSLNSPSPKVWADAYLLAFAHTTGAQLVTFDRAMASRAANAIVLA